MSLRKIDSVTGHNAFRGLKTEALVVIDPKDEFKLMPITLDEVRDDEVLVEMKYSGICHTVCMLAFAGFTIQPRSSCPQDIVFQQGLLPTVEFPAIFGHEGAGVVRAIGPHVKDRNLQVGDHVLLSFTVCETCKQCRNGHPSYCHKHPQMNHNGVRASDRSTPAKLEDGRSVRSQFFGHSSFSRMSVVHEQSVVKCDYPDSLAIYAPLGCGFQTGAGTILNVLKPAQDQSIVIFGLGSVGLTAIMAAKYLGVETIIAIDIVEGKLALAKELGASHTVNSLQHADIVKAIKDMTREGADFAIDCTGLVKVIQSVIECIAPCGTAVSVGVPPAGIKIEIDPLSFLLENKRYIGVIEGDSVPKTVRMQVGNLIVVRRC